MERVLVAQAPIAQRAGAAVRDAVRSARARTRASAQRSASPRASCGALDKVTSLDEDRILRAYLARDPRDAAHELLSSADGRRRGPRAGCRSSSIRTRMPELPLPRPKFEIFVYSPRVEGVHLRMGYVARGGMRWSDRREDFRTEVLGPHEGAERQEHRDRAGRRQGRLLSEAAAAGGSREDMQKEGIASYQTFIRGLLDVTDNIVNGKTVVRAGASCAATATIRTWWSPPTRAPPRFPTSPTPSPSSTATGSAMRSPRAARPVTTTRAWASPRAAPGNASSAISASSASTSSRRNSPVAGIGDMSGDVFGNGMLLSTHIRLVAAFDHRHIFLDPDPDRGASFRERERLFKLPRSSWDDYDAQADLDAAAACGRAAPSRLRCRRRCARCSGIEAATRDAGRGDARHPAHAGRPAVERRHRHVREGDATRSHGEVRDRANDAIRVDGREICAARSSAKAAISAARSSAASSTRCAGGRTQHGFHRQLRRRRLLRHRGQHQDPAGRPCAQARRLTRAARNKLLASMTEEVAALVLRDNYLQSQAHVGCCSAARPSELLRARALDALAGARPACWIARSSSCRTPKRSRSAASAGPGLTRPELAMVLATQDLR